MRTWEEGGTWVESHTSAEETGQTCLLEEGSRLASECELYHALLQA